MVPRQRESEGTRGPIAAAKGPIAGEYNSKEKPFQQLQVGGFLAAYAANAELERKQSRKT